MSQPEEPTTSTPAALPEGYHAGLLTAITVFLGFSLSFLRFWGLENPGNWTWKGVIAAIIIALGIGAQLTALFSSLDPLDSERQHYSGTVRWFFWGVCIVVIGVLFSIIIEAL